MKIKTKFDLGEPVIVKYCGELMRTTIDSINVKIEDVSEYALKEPTFFEETYTVKHPDEYGIHIEYPVEEIFKTKKELIEYYRNKKSKRNENNGH